MPFAGMSTSYFWSATLRAARTLARAASIAAVVWSVPAGAQEKHDPVAADYLFREARKAAQAGDYAKACPLFADSARLDPGAGALMNLADCEEHLGKVASAWEHWRESIDALGDKPDKRMALARRKIAALEKRLPRVTLHLEPGSPSDTKVMKDGVELGSAALGLPVPVDPGPHVIVVRAPKHVDKSFNVSLAEGEVVEVTVGAGALKPDDKPVARTEIEPKPKQTDPKRYIGYGLVGLGAVGLAVGAVAGLVAIGKKNTVGQLCHPDPAGGTGCSQEGVDAASTGSTMAAVSTVGFLVGAVAAAGGVTLIVLTSGKSSTSAALGPTPGGGGLSVTRTF